jgi:hypothetical protein
MGTEGESVENPVVVSHRAQFGRDQGWSRDPVVFNRTLS